MSTKSILVPFLLFVIIFISTSQASRQLWDFSHHNHFHSMFGSHGGAGGMHHGFGSHGHGGFGHGHGGFGHGHGGFGHGHGSGDMMTHTCTLKGPCQGKKLTCPETCFKSTNVNKDGYKHTSRSGGCSMDCTNKCEATCKNN